MISIIVPVLNEEKDLEKFLDQFSQFPQDVFELIVVDGGSTDQTCSILKKRESLCLVDSIPGRGVQMNMGAEQAKGDILLFLHADTYLPQNAFQKIEATFQKTPNAIAGSFKNILRGWKRKTSFQESWGWFLTLRSRMSWRRPLGDMGLFVRRDIFEELGGFQPLPFFEDYEFSGRLLKRGEVVRLDEYVQTSARRFEGKIVRVFFLMQILKLAFRLGVAPQKMERFYQLAR